MKYDVSSLAAARRVILAAIRAAQLGSRSRASTSGRTRTARRVRRHLPECRLHSVEGAAESSRAVSSTRSTIRRHGIKVAASSSTSRRCRSARTDRQAVTGGIAALFKSDKRHRASRARASCSAGRKVEFTAARRQRSRRSPAKHVVLATGSIADRIADREVRRQEHRRSTGARSISTACRSARRRRRRRHRPGAGQRVAPARLGGRRPRSAATLSSRVADRQWPRKRCAHFKKQGLDIQLGAKVIEARSQGRRGRSSSTTASVGEQSIDVDKLIVAVGRRAVHEGPARPTAPASSSTSAASSRSTTTAGPTSPNVWAVGDCVRGPMLAHKAKEEGVDGRRHDRRQARPRELRHDSVGDLHGAGDRLGRPDRRSRSRRAAVPYKIGTFPFVASGRARAMEATAGFVKLIADAGDDRDPRRAHHRADGRRADRRSGARDGVLGAAAEDLQRTIHAHPTLSRSACTRRRWRPTSGPSTTSIANYRPRWAAAPRRPAG